MEMISGIWNLLNLLQIDQNYVYFCSGLSLFLAPCDYSRPYYRSVLILTLPVGLLLEEEIDLFKVVSDLLYLLLVLHGFLVGPFLASISILRRLT